MKKQRLNKVRDRKGERGSILAMSMLGMLSLFLAVALGVDVSHLYLVKNELQNAADASALAGASGLNFTTFGITTATNQAVAVMNKYEFAKTGVVFPRGNIRFAANLSDLVNGNGMSEGAASGSAAVAATIRFVKVTTPASPVGITFGASVLGSSKNLSAKAIAGCSVPLNVFTGYLPVSVVDNNSADAIKVGNVYTIRAAPQNSVSPGNYQILAVDGPGANDDRLGLASSVRNPVGAGGYVDTKPGVSSGAIRQGINTRFDDYGSQVDPVNYPPDTNIYEDKDFTYLQYLNPAGPKQSPSHTGVAGRRVVLIPIVIQSEFDNGRTHVQINRFGSFFLRTRVQGGSGLDIEAEYIGIGTVVPNGIYDPNAGTNPGPPITKPVLYQ